MAASDYYHNDYLRGYISITEIPYVYWDEAIKTRALRIEPYVYYEELLKHTHAGLTGMSVFRCFNKTPGEYRSLNFYKCLLGFDSGKYRYLVPKEILHPNIDADKLKIDAYINTFKSTPRKLRTVAMYQKLSKLSFEDYLLYVVDYSGIPENERTKEKCIPMFLANLDFSVAQIPDHYKTPELAKMLLQKDFKKWFPVLPEHCKTSLMYEQFVKFNPVNNLPQVPEEKRTQKMYDIFFDYTLDTYIDRTDPYKMIPEVFFTNAMWKKLIILDDRTWFDLAPMSCIDQELAVILAKKRPYYIDILPANLLTEEVYLDLLRLNFQRYIYYLPKQYYNQRVIQEIATILVNAGDEYLFALDISPRLNTLIVSYKPFLINRFTHSVIYDIIGKELLEMVDKKYDIEYIARKYSISPTIIHSSYQWLSRVDKKSFKRIKAYLTGMDAPEQYTKLAEELQILEKIITSLGKTSRWSMTAEQKVKFAYLTGKFLEFPLERIFAYNNSSWNKHVSDVVLHFFESVLDFPVKVNPYGAAFDTRKVRTENEWLKCFLIYDFFKIKDGKQRVWYYYKSLDNEITPDKAKDIINQLRLYGIPLTLIIVIVAFHRYIDGELDQYIEELLRYDQLFTEQKVKKR